MAWLVDTLFVLARSGVVCTEEVAFFDAGFFVFGARGSHGVDFGDFGDGHVPPGFVAGNARADFGFDDDDRGARFAVTAFESAFEFFNGIRADGPGAEALGVGAIVDFNWIAFVAAIFRVAVVGAHTFVAETAAEATDAGEAVVVDQNDVQLHAFLQRRD